MIAQVAVRTQLCLSLYFFRPFSRVVFTFAGDFVNFLVAVRSPSGLTGVLRTCIHASFKETMEKDYHVIWA